MALRAAMPAGSRAVATPAPAHRASAAPSLRIALGGAAAIAVLLIGGQVLFPAKSYEMQQATLSEAIEMNGAGGDESPARPDARVAMRVPTESVESADAASDSSDSEVVAARYEEPVDRQNGRDEPASDSPPDANSNGAEPSNGSPRRHRLLKFLDGKLTLDVYKHPVIGSPEAPHVVVEMVSYNCRHCRATHRVMKQALARYGDQVALIIMVIPFERECNRLIVSSAASHRGACSTARMSLGVAALKPSAFAKFHDWLMADKEEPPPIDSVVSRAYSLVNRDRLRELSGGDQLRKQIAGYVNLFARLREQHTGNKEFGLPVQIVGDSIITGTVEKPRDLYDAWEKELGVKPR
jgi:hypothetical protein